MKKHICFVAPHIYPVLSSMLIGDNTQSFAGGAEVQQTIIARELVSAGFRVSVLTETPDNNEQRDIAGIRVLKLPNIQKQIPIVRNIHPRLTRIYSALNKLDIDIFYQRCAGATTLATALTALRSRKPFIYAGAHDLDFEWNNTCKLFKHKGGWRERQMYRIGLHLAQAVTVQHSGQAHSLQRWHGRRGTEIPNCYPTPIHKVDASNRLVIWVGTIKQVKQPELFLELARSLPNLTFRMIGGPGGTEGDTRFEEIRENARGISNLEFTGFVPVSEVERHFEEARLLINTSESEGFPNTFLQSWSRGVPTLSFLGQTNTNHRNSADITCSGLDEMQKMIAELSESDTLWQEHSSRCLDHFKSRHSTDVVIPRLIDLFDQLQHFHAQ